MQFFVPSQRPSETTKQHFCHAQNKQSESDDKNNDSTKRNTLTYLKLEGKTFSDFLSFTIYCLQYFYNSFPTRNLLVEVFWIKFSVRKCEKRFGPSER